MGQGEVKEHNFFSPHLESESLISTGFMLCFVSDTAFILFPVDESVFVPIDSLSTETESLSLSFYFNSVFPFYFMVRESGWSLSISISCPFQIQLMDMLTDLLCTEMPCLHSNEHSLLKSRNL